LRIEGQLLESEEILQGILNHLPHYLTVGKINALHNLAELLKEQGDRRKQQI
jgi:hypothetical protein